MFIYSAALFFLTIVITILSVITIGIPVGFFLGAPAFMAIVVAAVVLVIMTAVKASKGEYSPYPFCIRFFK